MTTDEQVIHNGIQLMRLVQRFPPDWRLTFAGAQPVLMEDPSAVPSASMVLMQTPPDGGWKTHGDRFGHPPGSPTSSIPCPQQWKFDDRCIVGVCMSDFSSEDEFLASCIRALKRELDDGGRQ